MNKSRFLRIAGFALSIELIVVVGMFISTSNPTTSSYTDAVPTKMVLPTVTTSLPPSQVASSDSGPKTNALTEPSLANVAVPTEVSNPAQAVPVNASSQQPAVVSPAHVANEPTQPPLLPQEPVPHQVVIQFKPNAKPEAIDAYVASVGGTINHKIDALNAVVITLPIAQSSQVLPSASAILNSEPDYFVSAQVEVPPSDPFYTQQWDLPVIGAPNAWKSLPADTSKVTIAVIDSGICADHPDLKGRILPGWDFVENDAVPQDEYGHGCEVAGIIAANIDDGAGMAGIAPNAMILPLRVLDAQGLGTYSNVAAAIVRATDAGAKVINLSVGGSNASSLLENAISYAVENHVTVVAAAGNTGGNILYPAAYAPVVAVGSVDSNLQRSRFSSYLPRLDTLAPGSDILATTLNQSYATVSGTSFAAAEVSGIVALDLGAGYPIAFDGSIFSYGPRDPIVPTQAAPTTPFTPIHIDGGDVQPLAVIGPVDSRVQVTNTSVTPNSAIVLIVFKQGQSNYICSGAVIAPQYVLTAGHCVYEEGIYSTNFAVYPGNNGSTAPFGVFGATLAYVPPTWVNTATGSFGNADVNYDWALLRLSSSVPTSILPFALSSFSDSFLNNNIPTYINAGYPGDKCTYVNGTVGYCPTTTYPVGWTGVVSGQGNTQWTASGTTVPAWLSTYLIGNQIDTYGGQSGSPLYYTDNNQPVSARNIITGLLSHSSTPSGNTCYGTVGALCPPQNSGNYFRRVTVDMLESLVATGVPFVNPSCYQVNIVVNGSGTVTRSLPRSQGCTSGTYTTGTTFSLSAVASPGYMFTGWSAGTSSNDVNTTYTVAGAATITATFVPQPPPTPNTVLAPGYYDDRNTNIGFSGGWTFYSGTGPSANTLSYTNVQNAIAQFAFAGDSLILYRTLKSDRGDMEVCIDGGCQTINSYATTLVWSSPVKFSGLGDATHVVSIRNLSNQYIDLDSIQVIAAPIPLKVGLHDDSDTNISYTGTWTTYNAVGPGSNTLHYTNILNAGASFQFTGSSLILYRTLNPDRGDMEVCIDGGCQTISSYATTLVWNYPVLFPNLANNTHSVTLRNLSNKYIDLDAVQIQEPVTPLTGGLYQENDPNITFLGAWTRYNGNEPNGGGMTYSRDSNAQVTFSFIGQVLKLYRTLAYNRGSFQICIDNSCQNASSYDPGIKWNVPITFSNLGTGTHNVLIRNLSSNYIDLDAVQILDALDPLIVGFYDDTDSNIGYGGSWMTYNSTGPSGNTLHYTNIQDARVSFRFTGDTLILYRTLNADRGDMEVCIDTSCQTTNAFSTTLVWNSPIKFPSLGDTTHSVTLRNLSATKYIDLDAVRVLGPAIPLNAGLYQEDNSNITFTGAWTRFNSNLVNGGSLAYTNDPNAQISFKINGDALTIYRTRKNDRGPSQVCVDSTCQILNNATPDVEWNIPYTLDGLGTGIHTVTISNQSSQFMDLDAIRVGSTIAALDPGSYDDRDTHITYNGLWYFYNGVGPQNSTISYTNIPSDEIRFRINGDAIRIYRTLSNNRGNMSVCIDLQPCVTVANYNLNLQWSVPVLFGSLGVGTHTVVIRNTGSGSTSYIDLDSIEVLLTTPSNLAIQPLNFTTTPTELSTETSTPLITTTVIPSTPTTSEVASDTPQPTATPTEMIVPSAIPSATPEIPSDTPQPTATPTEMIAPSAIPSATPEVPTNTALETNEST